ncbi:tyrosine-type recombinase/integrase [Pseudomonas tolaasii]|uniref:tyrosine-type recombinase/integrase n=1 Tax=Pseudomonas tolaasii TaxID=29442 RepID=UPI0002DB6090|nr:tyrosine-type recombinase/integrase [Pseudomonas tolaasii]
MTKLYRLTSDNFQLPLALLSDQTYIFNSASYIPMLRYPNGSWCHYSNCYMHSLYRKGLSRNNKGGTLKTYAGNISHLLRFCSHNAIEVSQMTDSFFVLFMQSLLNDTKSLLTARTARSTTSILTIGKTCIDLLVYIGEITGRDEFVGKDGVIKAERKKAEIDIGKGKKRITKYYWHHRSFPEPSPDKKRFPITEAHSNSIITAAASTEDLFLRKRRFVMLKLLSHTGCRRSELVSITTHDVYAALHDPTIGLKLLTAKKRGNSNHHRYLPISIPDLKFIVSYIEFNRLPKIKSLGVQDGGLLFISARTGKGLLPNTITQEISELAVLAGLNEHLSPHMYRHRFITQHFIKLIIQHDFNNPDDFRNLLINTESFKREVQQWTGHTNVNSLDNYIHLAFSDISNRKIVANAAIRSQHLSSLLQTVKMAQAEIAAGFSSSSVDELLNTISEYLNELQQST